MVMRKLPYAVVAVLALLLTGCNAPVSHTATPTTASTQYAKLDAYPDKSAFVLAMEPLARTDYRVGETLDISISFTNTAERGYMVFYGNEIIEGFLWREADEEKPGVPIPAGFRYLEAGESITDFEIYTHDMTGDGYRFTKPGVYTLEIHAGMSVVNYAGTKADMPQGLRVDDVERQSGYTYTLPPITITVTA